MNARFFYSNKHLETIERLFLIYRSSFASYSIHLAEDKILIKEKHIASVTTALSQAIASNPEIKKLLIKETLHLALRYHLTALVKILFSVYQADHQDDLFLELAPSLIKDSPEKTDMAIFLIEQGALSFATNQNRLEEGLKRHILENNGSSETLRKLYHAIVTHAFHYANSDIPFPIKKLALLAATLLEDGNLVDNVMRISCTEEKKIIDNFKKGFTTHSPVMSSVLKEETIAQHAPAKFRQIFIDIARLLQNVPLCFSLLKKLNGELALEYERAGIIDITLEEVEDFIFIHLPWPVLKKQDTSRTKGLLSNLLLSNERKHGINVHPDSPPIFEGFVEDETAKRYIGDYLFEEFIVKNNLLHSRDAHRLQCYIIEQAIALGHIDTPGISFKELVHALTSVWPYLLDRYPASEKLFSYSCRSPYYLHAALLLASSELPYLCHSQRKAFSRGLNMLWVKKEKIGTTNQLCVELDAVGSALTTVNTSAQDYYQEKRVAIHVVHTGANGYGNVFFKNRQARSASCLINAPMMTGVHLVTEYKK